MPLTAAGASLVAVGVLRVSRQGVVRKSSQGLGGGGAQARGPRARTGMLRRALEDEGKLGKAMAEGKLEKAMALNTNRI